ncbi:MAG: hypothetical protein R3E99_01000 [Burkholderiaceae bacterium]
MSAAQPRRKEPPALPRAALAVVALLAIANLLGAVGGGLVRLGALPMAGGGPTGPYPVLGHGAVLMAGFFGTLIALERAVALHRGLWVPALAGIAGLAGWLLGAWPVAGALWCASAAGLVGLYAWAGWRRAMSLPLAVEASGAVALLAANAGFWLGETNLSRLGWSAFLVLTIAGERRELTRMVRLPAGASGLFLAVWAGALVSVALAPALPSVADGLWWLSMAALAVWLLRFDVALRQWQARGWAGHTAICLSVGYVWLALGALLGLAGQGVAWHLVWLGFVMAMVFGHAPIMMPALAGWRPVPTRWALAPLGLLGLSLMLRVVGTLWPEGRLMALAGTGHALAFVFFGGVMVRAVRLSLRR